MDKLMTFSQKAPLVVILLIAAGLTLSIMNLSKVWLDSSTDSMMMAGDPDLNYYRETLDTFGSDNILMIYIEDERLFSVEKLKQLEAMVVALSDSDQVPGVQRVESLYSVNNIKGYPDYLDNNPLLDYPPETEAEAGQIKAVALSNPVFIGNIISDDGKKTVVNLYLQPSQPGDSGMGQRTEAGVINILYGTDDHPGFAEEFDRVFEMGGPYTSKTLSDMILNDLTTLIPLSFVVLLLMLIITTGSLNGAILPFITSSLSIVFTFGFMGALKLPLNLLTFIVPVLVIVIGSTEDVHILTEYQAILRGTRDRRKAVGLMARAIGTAIFLTSLTTFMGFFSIALNKVIVLIQFGLIAGFALFINPLTTCLVAPIYLTYFGSKKIDQPKKKTGLVNRAFFKLADSIVHLIKKHRILILILLLLPAGILAVFSIKIKVDNDPVSSFKASSQLIARMQTMHDELSGGQTFFIRINRDHSAPPLQTEVMEDETTEPDSIEISDDTGDEIMIDAEMGGEALAGLEDEIIIIEEPEELIFIDEDFNFNPVLPDTGAAITNTNLFQDPHYLRLIDNIQSILDTRYNFDKTISIATYIKMMHREMNVGQPGDYDMTPDPEDPLAGNLIAQYAMNLHYDQISTYVTQDWSEANILVRHNITSSDELKTVLADLNQDIRAEIDKIDPFLNFKITGENILVNKAADTIAISQVKGLLLLLVFIIIIMSVLFTSIKAGLLALIPNLFPIAIFMGIMGIFDIPLNIGTCMVAAIAIGISVDDTIHFMTRFNHEMRRLQNREEALKVVIHAEIKPIIATSIALMIGFAILAASQLIPILYFGLLSAIVMGCALLADLLITPILLTSFQLTSLPEMARLTLAKELQVAPVFENMSMWEIKKFALLGKVIEKDAGEYLTKIGEVDRFMYILLEGSVEVQRLDAKTGKSIHVVDLGIGSLIGEIALLRQCSRTANVVAREHIKYLAIDWAGLKRIEASSRTISLKLYHNMAKVLGQRVVNMTDKLEEGNWRV